MEILKYFNKLLNSLNKVYKDEQNTLIYITTRYIVTQENNVFLPIPIQKYNNM